MKTVILIATAALLAVSCDRNACTIEGDIEGLDGEGWIVLKDVWNGYSTIDSVRYAGGHFRLEVEKEADTYAAVIFRPDSTGKDNMLRHLILEAGEIRLEGDVQKDRFSGASGTPMNDSLNEVRNISREYYRTYDREEARRRSDSLKREWFAGRLTDAGRLTGIYSFMMTCPSFLLLKEIEKLSEPYRSLKATSEYAAALEGRVRTEPQAEGSDIIPYYIDFAQNGLDGKPISLKEVVGKAGNRYVLVDFWATWCSPCRDEIPHLIRAYDMFHGKGFEILGVSCDYDREEWRRYIEKNGIGWINVCEGQGADIKPWELYGLIGIPDNVLIDCSTGIIIGRDLRGDHLVRTLGTLFE